MLSQESRINSWDALGTKIRAFCQQADEHVADFTHFEAFETALQMAERENGWFTRQQVLFALNCWADLLTSDNLKNWLSGYKTNGVASKTIAIIAAGNIPLVALHDVLTVLISGHKAQVKLSANDSVLLPFLIKELIAIDSNWKDCIEFRKEAVKDYQAVIATGSTNTSRYFEHYFKAKPRIIRSNRNSVAVLNGEETSRELSGLADDIFRYYGLGCRSVSKIYLPKNYDLDLLFKALYPWKSLLEHKKYENNYDYNKAVFLMSQFKFLENGFFMIMEDERLSSPIASVFYENYDNLDVLKAQIAQQADQIQCVVSKTGIKGEIAFGSSQQPDLDEYADGIDTLEFLLKL